MKRFAFLVLSAALVLGLGGCALFNQAPAVVVFWDSNDLWDGSSVFLDATQSTDPDADDLDMAWSVVTAPGGSATFDGPASPSTGFGPLFMGDYELLLTVTDGTNTVEVEISFYVNGAT